MRKFMFCILSKRPEEQYNSVSAQVCERYSLPKVQAGVCRAVGMARLQQGRLASALQWLGRAGDEQALQPAGLKLAARIAEHAASSPSAADSGVPVSPILNITTPFAVMKLCLRLVPGVNDLRLRRVSTQWVLSGRGEMQTFAPCR